MMTKPAKYYVSGFITLIGVSSLGDALSKGKEGDRIIRACPCGCGGAAAKASHVIRDGKVVKVPS